MRRSPHNPQRYAQDDRALEAVPGQALPPRLRRVPANRGTPLNCRRLLDPLPPPPPEGTTIPVPPEIRPWVPDWLMPYQRSALKYGMHRSGFFMWHACGSGKTAASIYWALLDPGPIVVVTRASVTHQFADEFEHISTVRPLVLQGQSAAPIGLETRAVVLSWAVLKHWRVQLQRFLARGNGTVIFDEVHMAKSHKRTEKHVGADGRPEYRDLENISMSAAKVARAAKRRVGLTATPMRDRLADLWSQLDIVEPDCWGTNWDWVHRYCDARPGLYGGIDTSGTSNVDELNDRLREICHVVTQTEATANLPPKRRQVVYVKPGDQCRPSAFSQELKQAARAGTQALFEVKLAEAASRKRKWLVRYVCDKLEAKQKVVIFTGRKRDCDNLATGIEKEVAKRKLGSAIFAAHGGTPPDERRMLAKVYSKKAKNACLIGTTDAFGESLDGLQTTDCAIFAQLPWNHGRIEQAEGRFIRQGQDRPVLLVYTIAEGTVDEGMADKVLEKLEQVDSTVAELGVQSEAGATASVLEDEESEDELLAEILASTS